MVQSISFTVNAVNYCERIGWFWERDCNLFIGGYKLTVLHEVERLSFLNGNECSLNGVGVGIV